MFRSDINSKTKGLKPCLITLEWPIKWGSTVARRRIWQVNGRYYLNTQQQHFAAAAS